jgi:hypothetical protein
MRNGRYRIRRKTRTNAADQGDTTMTKIHWTEKLTIAAVTLVIGLGILELVASSMKFPNPEAIAQRQQQLQATFDRLEARRHVADGIQVAQPALPERGGS